MVKLGPATELPKAHFKTEALDLLSLFVELAPKGRPDVGIRIRAGIGASNEHGVEAVMGKPLSRGRILVMTSCHCGRRGYNDRAGKHQ
jgi:hypothetical protein